MGNVTPSNARWPRGTSFGRGGDSKIRKGFPFSPPLKVKDEPNPGPAPPADQVSETLHARGQRADRYPQGRPWRFGEGRAQRERVASLKSNDPSGPGRLSDQDKPVPLATEH